MVAIQSHNSVAQRQAQQRLERALGALALVICALVCGALLASGISPTIPLGLALVCGGLALAAVIWSRPIIGLFLLIGIALVIEQWEITGLSPTTAQLYVYQTLSGYSGIPLSISPLEMLLGITLLATLARRLLGPGARFERGSLFGPLGAFLALVIGSIGYGMIGPNTYSTFWLNAAWAETRAFFYLGIIYALVCNLIENREQVRQFCWLIILGIGLKGFQGVVRYIDTRLAGQQLEAITGHEDVVLFAAFFLFLAGLILFGGHRRQRLAMLWCAAPILLTLLVTRRRIGFVVLAVGLLLLVGLLLRTRRDLFFRVVPIALLVLGLYTATFWNATNAFGEPIRAFRSQFSPTSERDRLSNAWRVLENANIEYNIRRAPIIGLGFGRPYQFSVEQPSLDETGFTYWHYIAHNAIFWVWMKMGVIGFIGFWYLIGSAIIAGLLAFRQLTDGYLRAVVLLAVGLVVMQVFFSYGDLGLTYSRSMIVFGAMLGLIARLPALAPTPETTEAAPAPTRRAQPLAVGLEGR